MDRSLPVVEPDRFIVTQNDEPTRVRALLKIGASIIRRLLVHGRKSSSTEFAIADHQFSSTPVSMSRTGIWARIGR